MTVSTHAADRVSIRLHEVPVGLYLNGEWVHPEKTFSVLDPSNGETIAEVSDGSVSDARRALDAAVAAQEAWRDWAPRARASLFYQAQRLLVERSEAIAEVMVAESGKPLAEARSEVALSIDFFLWYSEQIAHLHGTFAPASGGGYRVVATHHPVGPSLLITPWNFPLLMIARKAGAALAAGCTVVTKSARETPLTSALFVEALHDAGFPRGVVNLIHTTSSAAVSSALMADPRLRKVSFTGSTGVGSTLLGQAAANITNASMELGGDGPFVVLDDADVNLAVQQAVLCKFRNAGQACVAANRIILHSSIAEEFTTKFVAATRALKVGNGFEGADMGPVISGEQRARLDALVTSILASGAELLAGGAVIDGPGYFYEPTVLRITAANAALRGEELFAPVATIYTVDSVQEAIRFANDTGYGLAAYLFTADISRAIAVSERLEFGMVGINRGIMADPAAPFGGIKASGLGREGGQDGIYEFLEPKYLAITVDEAAAR